MTVSYLPDLEVELCLTSGAFDFEASDTFTRSDVVDTLGSADSKQPWVTVQGTAGISSNRAYFSAVTGVTDSFTRADNASSMGSADSGQAWSALAGTAGIISNTGYFSALAGTLGIATVTSAANGDVQVTVSDFGTNQAGVAFRCQDASNGWRFRGSTVSGNYAVGRRDAGVDTAVATYSVTPVNGDVLSVHLAGDQISCYVNGVLLGTITDSSYQTATSHGVFANNTSARLDNFSTLGGASGVAVLRCAAGGDIQVTVPTFSSSASLIFRYQDSSNYWALKGTAGSNYTLRKTVAGVSTTVATYASAPVNGDVLKVRLAGTSITGFINGTSRLTTTDSTFQYEQFAGIAAGSTSERFDNFSAAFVWTDVTAYVQADGCRWGRGRQHELTQMETGTATVVFNNQDRRFDPLYTSSPYYPFLLPLRRVRITATWAGVPVKQFVGHVEDWPAVYNRTATDGTVEVTAVDRLAVIGSGFWSNYPDTALGMDPRAYWRMGAS